MIVVNHRVNTLAKLKDTPTNCGVEIDIRNYGTELVLNHEPFEDGLKLEEFLKNYKHGLLILNVKCEGIEKQVKELVDKYGIKDYFFLDVTFPFMIKYINQGWTKFAVRFSEFESIETCLKLKDRVEWIFIDNFTKLPIGKGSFNKLHKQFKLCIVSPELLKRHNEVDLTKKVINKYPVDAVLTDNISVWQSLSE